MSILVIFNSQSYGQEVSNIKENLMRMDDVKVKNPVPNNNIQSNNFNDEKEPKIFMDSTVYTVILGQDFNIVDVVNHTTNKFC